MPHDWVNFPELTNSQMQLYYFESPHKQILEDFRALVVKVHDGDTITVRTNFRDFDFPVRLLGIDAPELNQEGGKESQSWLEQRILNEEVDIIMNRNQRVGKWGRLLGKIFHRGMDLGEEEMRAGKATTFKGRNEGKLPDLNKELRIGQWL